MTRGVAEVATLDVLTKDAIELQTEVVRLRQQVSVLTTVVALLRLLLRVSGLSLDKRRLPEGTGKARVLRGINNALRVLPLRSVLRMRLPVCSRIAMCTGSSLISRLMRSWAP